MIPKNPYGFIDNNCNGRPFEPKSLSLGVRQKLKTDSQCESVLLRSLTPARLIRIKQITSDEA